jgi:seryl-tRNA synthetase
MLDINFIRENTDRVRSAITLKRKSIDLDYLLSIDDKRKLLQAKIDGLKFEQKKAGEARDIELAKSLKDQIFGLDKEYTDVLTEFDTLMLQIPQVLHPDVPHGKDDSENIEIKKVGNIPLFDFEIRDHQTLMEMHDMIDIERGVKLA